MFFTRPRMTITTYAYDNTETNELYAGKNRSEKKDKDRREGKGRRCCLGAEWYNAFTC